MKHGGSPRSTPEAIKQIREKGDTLDVYAPRIRRTGHVNARQAIVFGPTAALEMFGNGLPALEYAITAPIYLAGSTAIASVVYGAQRYREKGKVRQAEVAQQIIRDET